MKPRNGIADIAARSTRRLVERGQIAPSTLVKPGTSFTRADGDILIARRGPDGLHRTKESALVLARVREPSAKYRASDARWYVFARGER